jgi:8-oxo-dGTP pyrophosphatase MutT (NUDIX family)
MPHIHDKIDFTVEVFIVNRNKVLLRKHDKYKIWLSVGGHIELDEYPIQAAIREVKEEVGLDIEIAGNNNLIFEGNNYKELIPPKFLNRHKINDDHEHVTLVYFAKSKNHEINQSEKELSEECKWFTKEELDNYEIKESIKFYSREALKELGI